MECDPTAVEIPSPRWLDAVRAFVSSLDDSGDTQLGVRQRLAAEQQAAQDSGQLGLAEAAKDLLDDIEQLGSLMETATSGALPAQRQNARVAHGAVASLALSLRWAQLIRNATRLSELCSSADDSWDSTRLWDAVTAVSRATVEVVSGVDLAERYAKRQQVVTEAHVGKVLEEPVVTALVNEVPTAVMRADDDPYLVLSQIDRILKGLDLASPRPAITGEAGGGKPFARNVKQLWAVARGTATKNDGAEVATPEVINRARAQLEDARDSLKCLVSEQDVLSVEDRRRVRHHLSFLMGFKSESIVDAVRAGLVKGVGGEGERHRVMPAKARCEMVADLEKAFEMLREGAITLRATIPPPPPDD